MKCLLNQALWCIVERLTAPAFPDLGDATRAEEQRFSLGLADKPCRAFGNALHRILRKCAVERGRPPVYRVRQRFSFGVPIESAKSCFLLLFLAPPCIYQFRRMSFIFRR